MRHVIAALLVLILLPHPGRAETPGALLSEAALVATALPNLDDRRRALEPVIRAYVLHGDSPSALALIAAEPEASILGSLWIAAVKGALDAKDTDAALDLAVMIDDVGIRDIALSNIVDAQIASGDMAAARATAALITPGASAGYAIDSLVEALLASGQEDEARALAATATDPRAQGYLQLTFLRHLIEEERLDEAVAALSSFGPGPARDLALADLIMALAASDRLSEAEAMLAVQTEPRVTFRVLGGFARIAMRDGDEERARAMIAAIGDPVERSSALSSVVLDMAKGQGTGPALAFYNSNRDETSPLTRDRQLYVVINGLLFQGDIAAARSLLPEIGDPKDRDDSLAAIARATAPVDPAAALADLAAIADPQARFGVILALLPVAPDPALEEEGTEFARAAPDPIQRAGFLAQIATVLTQDSP